MVPGYHSAEFEEQHAVHVRDPLIFKTTWERICNFLRPSQSGALGLLLFHSTDIDA